MVKNNEHSIWKNKDSLESFVKGFKRASDILRMEKPDFILAPISGSVPFIDILNIVDRKFELSSVVYIPNSSRFYNREGLMKKWYGKFYDLNELGVPIKIICIDEVLSGSSAVVGYKQFLKSLEERARLKAKGLSNEYEAITKYYHKLNKKINYKILGISERGHQKNPAFRRLVNNNIVHLIEFDEIPTIDNINYNPLRFKQLKVQQNGRPIYTPEIEKFEITPEYLSLLKNIAFYVGVDPLKVGPVGLTKIEEGVKFSLD